MASSNQRERYFFLPSMEQMFSLSYLQSMSLRQFIDWDLAKAQSSVAVGRISNRAAFPVGRSKRILELFPGSMK